MNQQLPTREDLLKLPRWARVAFAARCARRVLPLVLSSRHFSEHQKEAVERAVQVAEHADATYVGAVVRAAAAAADAAVYADANMAARAAAYAAVNAARATSTTAAAYAADAAAYAAAADDAAAILVDFHILVRHSRESSWTDSTPVPASIFGEMWPNGAPDWAKADSRKEHAETAAGKDNPKLVFDLWIDPGQASKETLQKVMIALSELQIAAGGEGLEFKEDGDFIGVRERASV